MPALWKQLLWGSQYFSQFTDNCTAVVLLNVPLVPLMVRVLVPIGVLPFVEIVSVEVQDGPVADLGLKLAFERGGSPVTLKLTLPENPFSGVTVTTKLTEEP